MTQLTLIGTPDGPDSRAPFDAIKRVRPDGSEFWWARELMPLLGYGADWRNFANAIDRAQVSCGLAGSEPRVHFRAFVGATDLGRTGQVVAVPRQDVELSRFAAYLVAMNGDPRKQEIADAQAYFAIKTREAEAAPARRELTRTELAQMIIDGEREKAALEFAIVEQAPAVHSFQRLMDAEGTCSLAESAQVIGTGQNRLCEFLRLRGVLIAAAGQRYNTPYQKHLDAGRFSVRAGTRESGTEGELVATYTTRVTTKGLEYIRSLWDAR